MSPSECFGEDLIILQLWNTYLEDTHHDSEYLSFDQWIKTISNEILEIDLQRSGRAGLCYRHKLNFPMNLSMYQEQLQLPSLSNGLSRTCNMYYRHIRRAIYREILERRNTTHTPETNDTLTPSDVD